MPVSEVLQEAGSSLASQWVQGMRVPFPGAQSSPACACCEPWGAAVVLAVPCMEPLASTCTLLEGS